MANIKLKKEDSVVEVPDNDTTAINAWLALGYVKVGTTTDSLSSDSLKVTDLQVSGKIVLGSVESANSWELSVESGVLKAKAYQATGDYADEFTFTATASPKAVGDGATVGAQGATGLQGIQGATGIQGVTGLIGATGLQGIQGATGLQGETGIA